MQKLTLSQVKIMLKMQSVLNDKIALKYPTKDRDYMLAAGMECAEMIDHIGWKWWKKQSNSFDQARMELVDIWHFFLSIELDQMCMFNCYVDDFFSDIEIASDSDIFIFFDCNIQLNSMSDKGVFKLLTAACFSWNGNAPLPPFFEAMKRLDLSHQELFTKYIGKNTLNLFRQDNGYKEGTYKKIWDGLEDNEVLEDIMVMTDMSADDAVEQITNELQIAYDDLLK